MANMETVEYLVKAMIRAGVKRDQINMISRDCAWLLGVPSPSEAKQITKEYLNKYEKTDKS